MMRNEVLHGYMIHHRKYREKKSYCASFYSGIWASRWYFKTDSAPQYQPIRMQATGKSELKNFTKLEILNQPVFFLVMLFAGFYLNEIVLRLCPLEEAIPQTLSNIN